MAVRVDLNISLDGFATTTDQTPENPFGHDWARLVEAYVATRLFRARVLHETSGEGTTHLSPMSRLKTLARPTGFDHADAIGIRIPIAGADQWVQTPREIAWPGAP